MTHQTTTYNNSSDRFLHLASANGRKAEVWRLLLFLLMMVMGVGSAWAQTPSKWDGSTETAPDMRINDGSTEALAIQINSAAELAWFAANMNGKTWYVELTTDIDLDNNQWIYGEGSAKNFKGHFNGGGHTISNLSIAPESAKNNGFFCSLQGAVAARAEVKNLTIDGATILQNNALEANTITGALVGDANEYADLVGVTVKNVKITLDNLTNANYVGALAGRFNKNRSTIKDCTVEKPDLNIGNVGGAASYIGGAIGQFTGAAGLVSSINGLEVNNPSVTIDKITIKDCFFGAVFGRINNYCSVNKVTVTDPVLTYNNADNTTVAINLGSFAGGIVGIEAQETPVTNVTVNNTAQLIVGTPENSFSINYIRAGLIGYATKNIRLEDWTVDNSTVEVNSKLVNASSTYRQIGAFVGNMTGAAAAPIIINNIKVKSSTLAVKANIEAASYLSGFAGYVTTNCQFGNCTISSPVVKIEKDINTGASYIGGAIGDILGTAGNTSFINGKFTVTSPSVTINKNSVASSMIGSVFGRINTYSNVKNVTVSSPTLTYNNTDNPNVDLYLGTFAGNILGVNVQETVVSDITIEGDAKLTIGTEANSIYKIRAGIIGQVTTNARLEGWTIANSTVTVNGSLAGASNLGGFAGYLTTAESAPLSLKNVKITGNGSVKVTGGISAGSYLGGFAGQIVCADKVNAFININDAGIGNTANVSVGGDISASSYLGGFAGNVQGRAYSGTSIAINQISLMNVDLSITGGTNTGESFYGGLAGRVNTNCTLGNWNVETADKIAIEGNISKVCNIGGAFGRVDGTVNYPTTVSAINIIGLDMSLDGDLTDAVYMGGIAGQLTALATTPNIIEKSTVSGKIYTIGSHNYTNGDKAYSFGGIVGYLPQTATTFSEVNNCVSEVDFDLSGLTPATAGNMYSGFVVGGVIGRINTPSRLPESLYYSGKIYAPTAGVGPIVGVFVTKLADDKYIYDDYTGVNATAISAEEWEKVENWYFNGYKIGLSSDVTGQDLNTTESPTAGTDGIRYLTIGENTLTAFNSISYETKPSKTILAYTAISPAWKTNKATYPAYYMYYMQGVNRGNFVKDDQKEKTKQDVLSGALALLTLTDDNGDLTVTANRGFVNHTLTASATGATSYKWTVDGDEKSVTTGTFVIKPAIVGNTITVEAFKDGKSMARKQMKLIPVFRVADATKDLGTKTNPYLIGSDDELQLLSYLSTLPLSTQWEKTYTSADHYNKAYYEMDGDIDLSGVADFTPISCATGYLVNAAINQGYVFDGVFDGKMHKISNLKEGWYGGAVNVDNTHVGWGLFSIVGNPIASVKVGDTGTSPAAIRNLVIDNAQLTHKTDNTTFFYGTTGKNASNCCVGVLAGIVQSNTKIDNIEIHNSQITDDGSSNNYTLEARGLYVGGAVGSMQNAFNEVANPCANTKIQHVAAQVDITLEKPAFTNATAVAQPSQFNIGGIIGRYCATSALQGQVQVSMPAYTLYSGSVTASKAWISPVLGAVRFTLQQKTDDWKLYSKQWEGNNNADGTQLTIINAQYYKFYINGTLMTDLRPATACVRGARPIMEHTDATESQGTYDPQKYQGVNYAARYLDSEGTSLEHLNKDLFDDIYWAWDDEGTKKFVHMTTTQPMNVSVIQGDRVYAADIENGSEPLTYSWQESTDLENWTDIAGATSSTWNVPLSYNEEKYIVAHVIKDGKVYRSFPFLYTPADYIQPPAIIEDISGDQHTFSLDWHDLNLTGLTILYQWYQKDRKTEISGATNATLSLTTAELESYGGSVWCKVTLIKGGEEYKQFFVSSGRVVVFINGNNYNKNEAKPGNDNNDGMTPQTPVLTIDKANSLLDGGSWDNNIIVVMGSLHKDKVFQSSGKNPATLTGKWDGIDYGGVIGLKQIDQTAGEHSLNHATWPGEKGANCYVLGPTKFENLTFEGNGGGNCFIELHGNDAFFGKGLVMKGFANLSDSHGNFNKKQTIPEFTIILSATNLSKKDVDAYTNRTKPQEVTFLSGHYGRIMAGRFTQNFFANADNTAHSILGSPAHPYWAIVNVDIDKDNAKTDGNKTTYSCDINGLIAGLTDGTMYGDYTINFHGGNVVYIVGSNQGNPINNGEVNYAPVDGGSGKYGQWPNASYLGRTVINVEENTNDNREVKIGNIYAGGLGRKVQTGSTGAAVDMYFYGRTEVNMKSGTVDGSVYGGGTGGVIGINPWDAHVPYATLDADNASNAILNGVQYGDNRQGTWSSMTAESPKANVILHNLQDDGETYETEMLDLSESSTTVNISGGTITGNVYGGGYGFVPDMPADATMQGVGSVFGTSNINISGGTIGGSVYGGSEGSAGYYNLVNKYGQVINHIAEMNGTVNMKITGTDAKYPTIGGNIFGGGLGIESKSAALEYLRIATAGNIELGEQYKTDINILIDLPESHPFNGYIYGGGEMGLVDGNTTVVIKGGTFEKDIFGGGKGEDGHPNKAKVTGKTKVIVDSNWTE